MTVIRERVANKNKHKGFIEILKITYTQIILLLYCRVIINQ